MISRTNNQWLRKQQSYLIIKPSTKDDINYKRESKSMTIKYSTRAAS